ncbi:helix-turn-helix domain-containing protein [Jingyaoa shaoxingensis]|uniref:Helix-turn-helix transcriptional regulator n=1 Tax=Jingyaoa shaoxingensis TaxID=2763671 RepID=A0ABR7NDJ0_9FIRM|nr:helix-turn-helix transcriptional regulator [Jingyaoa shaoxingensis]MBC8574474.1 helix-turn-helix transcriptional regulator [Jingyaoa shaoxingensis]
MNERLKKLRKTLDLTQQTFADRIGIARGNVGAYEVGKNAPSDAVISLICREFNVNENWLRTGEGEMFIEIPRDDQIASFIGDILKSEDDSFKKRFIAMLKALDESDWEVLEKMSLLLTQEKE